MNTKRSVVVSGEASETDSEDNNILDSSPVQHTTSYVQGAIIAGEDSESQDEQEESSPDHGSTPSDVRKHLTKEIDQSDSLLHRKLRECNNNFYQDLELLCISNINMAAKDLSVVDQHLLRSQITLQSAITSLKVLNNNSINLKEKLNSIVSLNFLSTVKTL
ncbi:biogenesis of lysosome-related organelles complex 1 subunit 3 [Agrilus planipennis]|uniref:Biogenesis of lysosome-related organelles complex 1 subunit 3 n=1 Tax=Agrilus planipennis TaxID=224129 RepID=A0A7F5R333_AGRPL|nr:biogenesis of lysosome-related organelles complex 1 subunit 3 [Agrilus planipennis]